MLLYLLEIQRFFEDVFGAYEYSSYEFPIQKIN